MSDSGWYKIMMYGLEFLGRYYSSYRGFVMDNNDPNGMNRVKVICHVIDPHDKSDGAWAYPKAQWGGKDYGLNILPRKGDMVWIEFEHGDLDYPIWSFASYGLNEKPKEFDSHKKYGFKTPAGNLIIIDDTEDVESILVKHKHLEEYIKLLKEKIELEAAQIYLGKNGDEKAIMGETLYNKLDTLLTTLSTHTHTTNAGPSGPPIDASVIINIQNTLDLILSNKVKIDR